jgi:hypothetical protein
MEILQDYQKLSEISLKLLNELLMLATETDDNDVYRCLYLAMLYDHRGSQIEAIRQDAFKQALLPGPRFIGIKV